MNTPNTLPTSLGSRLQRKSAPAEAQKTVTPGRILSSYLALASLGSAMVALAVVGCAATAHNPEQSLAAWQDVQQAVTAATPAAAALPAPASFYVTPALGIVNLLLSAWCTIQERRIRRLENGKKPATTP